MREAFVKIGLHGLRQEEAIKVIHKALTSAGPTTYQLRAPWVHSHKEKRMIVKSLIAKLQNRHQKDR